MKKCGKAGCKIYPYYGIAPHVHDLSITGSFIGSTKTLPKEHWPKSFVEDKDEPGMGVYYCPHCMELENETS